MTQSADSISLKGVLNRKTFLHIRRTFHKRTNLPLAVCDKDGKEIRSLCERPCLPEFCRRIRKSRIGAARCRQHRQESLATAAQLDNPQITICHAGIVSVCVPVMDGAVQLGGVFFGKCLSRRFTRKLEADVQNRLKDLRIYPHEILEGLSKLPVVSSQKIHSSAALLQSLIHETVRCEFPTTAPKLLHPTIQPVSQRGQSQKQPNVKKMAQLKPAINLMRYNYAEPLTLAAIAYAAGLSPSRLGHLFAEQMGTTVMDYLNTIRIDHAKRLLKTTDTTCTQIAWQTGFNSPAYFTRVFKKHTGLSPSQFRTENNGE